MNTDLISHDVPIAERGVEDWRFQQLLAAGWPERQALVLAAHHDIDLHLACDLLEKGCDLALAGRSFSDRRELPRFASERQFT